MMIIQVFAIKTLQEMQMCLDAGLDRWELEVGKAVIDEYPWSTKSMEICRSGQS